MRRNDLCSFLPLWWHWQKIAESQISTLSHFSLFFFLNGSSSKNTYPGTCPQRDEEEKVVPTSAQHAFKKNWSSIKPCSNSVLMQCSQNSADIGQKKCPLDKICSIGMHRLRYIKPGLLLMRSKVICYSLSFYEVMPKHSAKYLCILKKKKKSSTTITFQLIKIICSIIYETNKR